MNLAVKHSPSNGRMLIWAIICSILLHAFLVVVIPNLNFEKAKLRQVLNIELVKTPEPPPFIPPAPKHPEIKTQPTIKTLTKPTRSTEAQPPPAVVQTEVLAVAPKVDVSPSPPAPILIPEPPKLIVPSQAEINAALNGYNNALWGKIGKYKQYPKIAQMRGWQGEVIVELLLDGNGKLKSKKIITSSGYEVLDKQALEMIDKAAPFPSPPEALRASSFSITVPIPFKLE